MTRYRHLITDANRRWWTLGAMCFALFMIMLDNTVVNVALPSIQRDLHASISSLEWTVNAYTLTFAVLLVTGGRLGDIFGRRRMFLFGVVVFAVSSAAIGLAPDQGWLVAGRAIQGIGGAFMMPGTLSIISNTFPARERGRAIGTWAGVSALALALGPAVGGALTEHHDQVAGLLGDPFAGRMRAHAAKPYEATLDLYEEQDVHPGEPDRLDREEVAGQHPGGLGAKELGPRGAAPPRGRPQAMSTEDVAHGGA